MSSKQPRQGPQTGSAIVVRVWSIHREGPTVCRFLGPIRGLLIHYTKGESIPCPGADECPASTHRTKQVWRGYAAVEAWIVSAKHWLPTVLEVTANLEEQLRDRSLRGEVWYIKKRDKAEKSDPVDGVYCESLDPLSLAEAFDIVPVLERVYNVHRFKLDVVNPMPARILLEPVKDAPPNLPLQAKPAPASRPLPKEEREKLPRMSEAFRAKLHETEEETSRNGTHKE